MKLSLGGDQMLDYARRGLELPSRQFFRYRRNNIIPNSAISKDTIELNTIKAFPTAQGFGRIATGGRGGTVIKVTSLANSGAGTLREALTTAGARTIVFEIGGTITLSSKISVTNGDLTIAGETAPGDGILITSDGNYDNGLITFEADNIICRGLKWRIGRGNLATPNLLDNGWSNGNTIVIDHNSFAFSSDESFSIHSLNDTSVQDITFSNNIISHSLNYDNHAFGQLVSGGATNCSFYRNLYVHNRNRSPLIGGGTGSAPTGPGANHELVENVVYNWWYFGMQLDPTTYNIEANIINNVTINGSNTSADRYGIAGASTGNTIYARGNYSEHRTLESQDEWDAIGCEDCGSYMKDPMPIGNKSETAFNYPLKDVPTKTRQDTIDTVLSDAGAFKRDSVDNIAIADVQNDTGAIINHEDDIGGMPTINNGTSPTDTSGNGIPDSFQATHNISNANSVKTDWTFGNYNVKNTAGYTNLEMYLFTLTGEFSKLLEEGTVSHDNTYNIIPSSNKSLITLNTIKAFPTAKGKGQTSTGGRGGTVIKVTNLNASGAGSLKAALDTSGPRTIVFDVAGVIRGSDSGDSNIWYPKGDVTIDGSSAPGEGIELQNITFVLQESNVIFRQLRMRLPSTSASGRDCIRIKLFGGDPNFRNLIVDRCSFYYGTDEAFSTNGANADPGVNIEDFTVQRCIFAHNWYATLITWDTRECSFVDNFSALNIGREMAYSSDATCAMEVINNLCYDVQWNHYGATYGQDFDFIGNYMKMPTGQSPNHPDHQFTLNLNNNSPDAVPSDSVLYYEDNLSEFSFTAVADTEMLDRLQPSRVITGSNTVIPYAASEVPTRVLGQYGAGFKPWSRDSIDQAVISHYENGTGTSKGSTNPTVDFNDDTTYENPANSSQPANYDSIVTGIPDSFSTEHNLTSATEIKLNWIFNTYNIVNNAGYTAIEMYHFWLNKEFDELIELGEIEGDNTYSISSVSKPNITLDTLKAFPAAFGAGQINSGGRGQQIVYVTNLNSSGPGSYAEAVSQSNRIIIPRVEGIVEVPNGIEVTGITNISIFGQLAPGQGLIISGERSRYHNAENWIVRHMTYQNMHPTLPAGTWSALIFSQTEQGQGSYVNESGYGKYLDHISARYGIDQTLDISSRVNDEYFTIANCLMAEGLPGHNTGGIIGNSGGLYPSGDFTVARNMYYNLSHRFHNMGGLDGNYQHYNNLFVNWRARLTRTNGHINVDWYNNYGIAGNVGKSSGIPVNKIGLPRTNFKVYTGFNFIEDEEENIVDNQRTIWVYYKTDGSETDNDPISESYYVNTKQHNFEYPSDGVWDTMDVPDNLLPNVGHCRGVKPDGSPGFFRDSKDADYVDKTINGTMESTYRDREDWDHPTVPGTTVYASTSGDGIPDWFKQQFGLNVGVYEADGVITNWDFGSYTVTNNAGYTNIEMCAAYYAQDFDNLPVDDEIVLPNIQLTELKAFPTAFGYAKSITGGRGGTLIEVTNLNDSGTGSLRAALEATGTREIIVRVSGTVVLSSDIQLGSANSNFTLNGHTAPKGGLQVTGGSLTDDGTGNCRNMIIRHITWRSNYGTPGTNDAISFTSSEDIYLDHLSVSYGFDELISIKSSDVNNVVTIANTLYAEGHPDHNRGGILGGQPSDSPYSTTGKFTHARNAYYNVSARHPNFSGTNGTLEVYNNLIANWYARLTRFNGSPKVDWYNNYAYAGNHSKWAGNAQTAGNAVNKFSYTSGSTAQIFSQQNIVEGFQDTLSDDNTAIWEYFLTSGGKTTGDTVEAEFFSSTRLGDADYPPEGLLTAQETFNTLLDDVGHNKGTDSIGQPWVAQDSLDSNYINNIKTDNTESTYRAQSSFNIPNKLSGVVFPSSNNNGISDLFMETHSLTGDGTNVTTNWTFDNYTVTNTAGYTDREIYWAWVAGDLDKLFNAQ